MIQPMYECPQFNHCSAPRCPLDPDIDLRSQRYPEEDKCKAQKPTRVRIGLKHSEVLPHKGLTKKEYNGLKNAHNAEDLTAILTRKYRG